MNYQVNAIFALIVIAIGSLFYNQFLKKYMEKKGDNLATKEDIGAITDEVEKVKVLYTEQIEKLKINLHKEYQVYIDNERFLKDRSYKQYTQLYSIIYKNIIQSEYLRYFHMIEGDNKSIPYLELQKERKVTKTTFNSDGMTAEQISNKIDDPITEFNKINLVNLIIEKGELASEKLMKLSIAYRYIHEHYLDKTINTSMKNKFQEEELHLIYHIVRTIIIETNKLKKICKLNFNEKELETGHMEWNDVSRFGSVSDIV